MTVAHDQVKTSHWTVHYPEHGPRESDPCYKEFDHYHRTTKLDPEIYQCFLGKVRGDFSDCTLDVPLELHHAHIEWALQNSIDFKMLEKQYPGISDPNKIGSWLESEQNLIWLCQFHHRGHGGAHVASASDWESQKFSKGLIT